MSQIGLTTQPTPGDDISSFIDFLNQRKKKKPDAVLPQQSLGASPNASMYGGSSLMSPAMLSIMGR